MFRPKAFDSMAAHSSPYPPLAAIIYRSNARDSAPSVAPFEAALVDTEGLRIPLSAGAHLTVMIRAPKDAMPDHLSLSQSAWPAHAYPNARPDGTFEFTALGAGKYSVGCGGSAVEPRVGIKSIKQEGRLLPRYLWRPGRDQGRERTHRNRDGVTVHGGRQSGGRGPAGPLSAARSRSSRAK